MKSTRLRTLQSVRNRNQSSTEGQTETTRSRNRRSSIREEVDEEDSINGLDRDKESVTQETETDNALLTARERNSKENRADSGNKKTGNPQQNDLNAASWEDKVYDFLASNQAGMLDEDEVVSRMNRMVRSATQQFHAAKSLMNSAVSDAIVFDSCYEEAQDQAVIDDILKDLFGSFTSLDRRAVSWIKRTIGASGRRQKSKHNLLLGNTKRRLTRGMAKTSNGTKDEHILFDAVREIEREKDMPRRSERRLSASSYNADDEGNRHKSARHKRRLGDDQSATSSTKLQRRDGPFMRKPRPIGDPVLDLSALESDRQTILKKWNKTPHHESSFESFMERSKKRLPPEYRQMGIVHRLPGWDDIQEYTRNINKPETDVLLKEQMEGRLTRFLICEYFHSDLDKAWFESDEWRITERGHKGLPKSTYWEASKTRKQTRHVQKRRFSKSFIRGEITKRNEYRQAVRFFQQHVNLLDNVSFPYDIPEPIPVGTVVAAWDKTRRIIARGTVISHNVAGATYLVSFQEKEDASQEIPDSCVATIGGPDVLRRATFDENKSPWGEGTSLSLLDDCKTKVSLLNELRSLSQFEPFQRRFSPRNQVAERTGNGDNAQHVKEQVAEREALICLTDSIDKLLLKKDILLENLESFGHCPPEDARRARYCLLQENCRKIDTCLNRLLNYVEMFYGTSYLPNHHAGQAVPSLSRDKFKSAFDRLPDSHVLDTYKQTGNMFAEQSKLSADTLMSEVLPSQVLSDDQQDSGEDDDAPLSLVGRILLSSSFVSSGIISNQATAAISAQINRATTDHRLPGGEDDYFMASAYSARREALSELREAAELLHAEVALASL